MRILGEREAGQVTLELALDMRTGDDVLSAARWAEREVEGETYLLPIATIDMPISEDHVLREKLVASLAAALGVPYTTSDRRRALEQDFRRERAGEEPLWQSPQWRNHQESGL